MHLVASAVFLLSAAFAFYIIFGYPLLLSLLARRRPRPVRKKLQFHAVSVLLAVHNGEKWVREKIGGLLSLDYPRELLQILVISDGSTDQTDTIVQEFAPQGVELLRVPKAGKAQALNAGMARARGDILFFTDVRQPLAPACLKNLVACFGDPTVGGATGHIVFIDDRQAVHTGMYWRYEKWIRRNQTLVDSLLVATGCIYALRRDLATPIPPDLLIDDAFLPLNAVLRGYRFVFEEEAVAYEYYTALDIEFHRKLRTLAGIYQLLWIYPALLNPAHRMWLDFVSHKLGRVLLPFALLAIAASSFWLPGPAAAAALAAQALFYLLALVDPWLPHRFPLKPLSSVARTFVVLMTAALLAVRIFFVPAAALWRETRVAHASVSRRRL